MAKFKQNNIELRDGQKLILDSAKGQWITSDGSQASVNTTLSGVTPTEDYHLTRKDYVDSGIATLSGSLVLDHSGLNELDYASSGHTGFQPAGDYATNATVTSVSGSLQGQLDGLTVDHGELTGLSDDDHEQYVLADGTRNITGQQTMEDDLVVRGDLVVSGTQFIVEVEEVLIEDHLLTINYGEVGAGVSFPIAGIEVDRGSETNYQFVFVEDDNNFQVGISGSLQAVATREDSPSDGYVPVWDAGNYTFSTASGIALNDLATDAELTATSGVLQTDIDGKLENILEDTTPQLGGDLDLNEYYIEYTPAPASDETGSGEIATMTVDANATGVGALLYIAADGNLEEADANSTTTMPGFALALETGTGSKKVLLRGFMRDDSWSWTPGRTLYASETAGAMSQTAPVTSESQVQVLGVTTHADRIWFNPSYGTAEVA